MKRLFALILALALLASVPALAATVEPTVYAQVRPADGSNKAKVYNIPGDYREAATTLTKDTFVFITFEGTVWHKIKQVYGNVEGWMKAEDIKITTRGYSAANYGCTLGSAYLISSSDGYAALRWGPATYYDKIDNLPNGYYVWKYENVGSWTRVLLEDGRSGYVSTSLLKKTDKIENWPGGLYAYVQVTGDYAAYRNYYGFSSKVVGNLKSGDVIEILTERDNFYSFYNPKKDEIGYISNDVVSPESLNETITRATLYYDHPINRPADIIWELKAGTKLKVLASDGYVSRIQYADGEGYLYDYTLKY